MKCFSLLVLFLSINYIGGAANAENQITKEFDLKGFTVLNIGSTFHIKVDRDDNFSVKVSGDEKYVNKARAYLDGNILIVEYEMSFFSFGSTSGELKVEITMPDLEGVEFSGATHSAIKGFDVDNIRIEVSGACVSDIDINAKEMELELSGASKMKLKGDCSQLNLVVSGASKLSAVEFEVNHIDADLSGASSARVYAIETLKVVASGASSMVFSGDAQVSEDVSGASSIRKK